MKYCSIRKINIFFVLLLSAIIHTMQSINDSPSPTKMSAPYSEFFGNTAGKSNSAFTSLAPTTSMTRNETDTITPIALHALSVNHSPNVNRKKKRCHDNKTARANSDSSLLTEDHSKNTSLQTFIAFILRKKKNNNHTNTLSHDHSFIQTPIATKKYTNTETQTDNLVMTIDKPLQFFCSYTSRIHLLLTPQDVKKLKETQLNIHDIIIMHAQKRDCDLIKIAGIGSNPGLYRSTPVEQIPNLSSYYNSSCVRFCDSVIDTLKKENPALLKNIKSELTLQNPNPNCQMLVKQLEDNDPASYSKIRDTMLHIHLKELKANLPQVSQVLLQNNILSSQPTSTSPSLMQYIIEKEGTLTLNILCKDTQKDEFKHTCVVKNITSNLNVIKG